MGGEEWVGKRGKSRDAELRCQSLEENCLQGRTEEDGYKQTGERMDF